MSENENRKQKLEHVTAVGRREGRRERERGREGGREREGGRKKERREKGEVKKMEVVLVRVQPVYTYPPKRPVRRKLNVLNPEVDFSLLSCV